MPLQTGLQAITSRPYAANGVMEGVIPLRRDPVGTCEIWGCRPSLWLPVVETLGFTVTSLRFPSSPEFVDVMRRLYPSLDFKGRRRVVQPAVVFTDDASLQMDHRVYWSKATWPHIFYGSSPPPSPPTGWIIRSHHFAHSLVGGATTCSYYITMFLRPEDASLMTVLPPISQRPWSAITASLDLRHRATPVAAPPFDPTQSVLKALPLADGSYAAWGLYPHDRPLCFVTMGCQRSVSGWGSRRLAPSELAHLWNVPISLIDSCSDADGQALLRSFMGTAPIKILSTGADYLITCFLRGGLNFGLARLVLWMLQPMLP